MYVSTSTRKFFILMCNKESPPVYFTFLRSYINAWRYICLPYNIINGAKKYICNGIYLQV